MTSLRDNVGPYRLLEEIGVGGMGEVHLALDTDGRTVAVKVLHPVVARDEMARRRLEREVATMRRVRSPYVAEVLDADFTARRPYVVTHYVQGRSLEDKVRAGGPLRGAALLRAARGLARALHAIHEAGIVHRDLKPANVILVGDHPVVIDFGLAHVLDATRLTRTGTAIGTPGYLAPEILDGGRAGPAADVFSWGATVVFAAAGRSPYGSGPAQAVFSRVLRGRFELDGVPEVLIPLVESALAVDPEFRPGTGDLLEDLAVLARRRSSAVPRRPPAPRPRPVTAAHPQDAVRPPAAAVPPGRTAVPPGRPAVPSERRVPSPGRPAVPPGRPAVPPGRRPAAPSERPAASPGRPAVPSGRPVASPERKRPPAERPRPDAGDPARPEDARADAPAVLEPAADASAERPGDPPRRFFGTVRVCALLAAPVACYTLPVVAVAVTLTVCAAGYTWDAIERAWRRMAAARGGGLARAAAGLAALVTVPAQTVLRLTALLAALVLGYSAVLAATWWLVIPHARALAVPLGVLAVVAGAVRAWYSPDRRPARLGVSLLAAGLLAAAVAGVPDPSWWPVVLP